MCAQTAEINGIIPVAMLERLCEILVDDSGSVNAQLRFYRDENHRRIVAGSVSTDIRVECQRCLGSLQIPLHDDFLIALIESDEQARQLPKTLEPFIFSEGLLDIRAMLTEQLLLCMPLVAHHAENDCTGPARLEELAPTSSPETMQGRAGPFENLRSLLEQKDKP
ncbi:MAG: YceD family protein [Pseudomonadales bacterium]|nr:YceD family protein [Pseudomonadales bacterium]